MSQTMYEQAILDAQSLKRMAEETAKNQLIKSLTPQIKQMIEEEIFAECPSGSSRLDESVQVETDVEEDDETKKDEQPLLLDEDGEISESDLRALASLVRSSSPHTRKQLSESLKVVRRKMARMIVLSESIDSSRLGHDLQMVFLGKLNAIIKETLKIRREAILIKESGDDQIYNNVEKTLQEIKAMARKLNRGVFSRLFEADELNELDATLMFQPEDEEEEAEVEELLGDLDIEFEMEVPMGDEDVEEEEVEDVEVEDVDVDVEEEEFELDLGETDDVDETYEIDEAALRRALRSLTEDAADEADAFGGGTAEGDVIVDLDEDDLLHALNDELGDPGIPTPTVESRRRRARRARRGKVNESRRSRRSRTALQEARKSRVLKGQLRRATGAVNQLQGQLTEMNLFNAKLLYANKLMQNKNLNARQQRTIVEALDSAKTLREAKLLYKSLSTGISKGKTLKESGGRVRGSSSKSTTRSGTRSLNEGAGQTDRWATLAGIHSGKK